MASCGAVEAQPWMNRGVVPPCDLLLSDTFANVYLSLLRCVFTSCPNIATTFPPLLPSSLLFSSANPAVGSWFPISCLPPSS